MNPVDAVRGVLARPLRFSGRASRSEFWAFALFTFLAVVLAAMIDAALHRPVLQICVGVLLLLPLTSVAVRRLHDIERSGWWVLVELVPFVGTLWLAALCAQPGNSGYNEYGPPPSQPAAMEGRP